MRNLLEAVQTDSVSFDLPLFIRLLEWSREDSKSDNDLHVLMTNVIALCKTKTVLTMEDYDAIVTVKE
jgi:hypothetical protein